VVRLVLCRVLSGRSVQPLCHDGFNKELYVSLDLGDIDDVGTGCAPCLVTELLHYFLLLTFYVYTSTKPSSECRLIIMM